MMTIDLNPITATDSATETTRMRQWCEIIYMADVESTTACYQQIEGWSFLYTNMAAELDYAQNNFCFVQDGQGFAEDNNMQSLHHLEGTAIGRNLPLSIQLRELECNNLTWIEQLKHLALPTSDTTNQWKCWSNFIRDMVGEEDFTATLHHCRLPSMQQKVAPYKFV